MTDNNNVTPVPLNKQIMYLRRKRSAAIVLIFWGAATIGGAIPLIRHNKTENQNALLEAKNNPALIARYRDSRTSDLQRICRLERGYPVTSVGEMDTCVNSKAGKEFSSLVSAQVDELQKQKDRLLWAIVPNLLSMAACGLFVGRMNRRITALKPQEPSV